MGTRLLLAAVRGSRWHQAGAEPCAGEGAVGLIRHARPCAGHPRLVSVSAGRTWMAGHRRVEATPSFVRLSPAMTERGKAAIVTDAIPLSGNTYQGQIRRAPCRCEGHAA